MTLNNRVYVANAGSNSVSVISAVSISIKKLISTIDGMYLPRGNTKSLEAILNAVIKQLSRNSDVAACNILAAFLHQVNAYEGSRL